MIVDLHVTSEGDAHIVCDAEGFAALVRLPGEVRGVHPVGACPCPHQVPPHTAVSLLGFVDWGAS